MTDVPETPRPAVPSPRPRDRVAIAATCTTCRDGIGFATLMVSKLDDGGIKLDPHVAGFCVFTLDEKGATALFDLLGEWLP